MSEEICANCKYCGMSYDKHDWEVYYCTNESGAGCDDPWQEACKEFEYDEQT